MFNTSEIINKTHLTCLNQFSWFVDSTFTICTKICCPPGRISPSEFGILQVKYSGHDNEVKSLFQAIVCIPAFLWSDEVGKLSKPPQSCPQTPRGTVLQRYTNTHNITTNTHITSSTIILVQYLITSSVLTLSHYMEQNVKRWSLACEKATQTPLPF